MNDFRKLLNTLYITNPDHYLSLDGENIVVKKDNENVGRIPLHNIQAIVTYGYTGASPALMGACATKNIDLCFMKTSGRFQARVVGENYGNVLLRKIQYRVSDSENESLKLAQNIIIGKLYNSSANIARTVRDNGVRVDVESLEKTRGHLKKSIKSVKDCKTLEELRGVEGEAAKIYFSIFDDLILNQKSGFIFEGRSKRPPLDNVNTLLSFLYTILSNDCASALTSVGLDPYVGFLHQDRPGRISLALDLMEEFRSVFVDRLVLTLINRKEITESGFIKKDNGAVIMDEGTKKIVLQAWQNKKKMEITHPFLEEKIEWGMLPYVQAQLLAKYLRNDIDDYPPFLWK